MLAGKAPNDEPQAPKLEIHLPKFPSILKEPIASVSSTSRIPSFSFIKKETPVETPLAEIQPEIEVPSSIFVSRPTSVIEEIAQTETETENKTEEPASETDGAIAPQSVDTTIPSYSFKGFAEDTEQKSPYDAVAISEAFAKEQVESEEEGDADDTDYTNNHISSIISNQLEGFKKPVEESAKFEFENENNLHTIDYFASQGIKIDLTKLPQDKLTVQMRSFTDWLKQIKKTDPNPQDLGTDPELEKAIQNIAKTSIEAKEIVTETMADVFIKQGKVNKAIQLYIKLSFLDPSKSTYFANKIQQLKGI